MAEEHFIGMQRKLRVTFKDSGGTVTDPTTITFTMKDGAGTLTSKVHVTDAEVIKESTGIYHLLYTIIVAGRHNWGWKGTGSLIAARQTSFKVQPDLSV